MKLLYIIFLFFGLTGFSQDKKDWQLKKVEDGISVYTKDLEYSNLKELKAVFSVKTSLSSIIALLNDSESFPQWAYRCGQCSTFKKISDTEFLRYQTVVAPWPVDDRDFTVRVKVSQNPHTKVVVQQVSAVSNVMPEVNGLVRIIIFRGVWTLTPSKNGMINIEYQLLLNPGGNIPAWLINLSAVDGPIENSKAMKEWLLKDKYKNAVLSYIQEP